MKNNINREVIVLLVSDSVSDIHEIRNHLEKITDLSCRVRHYSDISQVFREFSLQTDIMLLDMNLIGSGRPRKLFRQMRDIVGDLPIIVFTEKEDHELALLLIEDGAADNVTRGQLESDPFKLRDVIEFSLARDKIVSDGNLKNAGALSRLGKRDAILLRKQKDQGADDLRNAKEEMAEVLDKMQEKNTALLKEKDDILFWMSGGYSVNAS